MQLATLSIVSATGIPPLSYEHFQAHAWLREFKHNFSKAASYLATSTASSSLTESNLDTPSPPIVTP